MKTLTEEQISSSKSLFYAIGIAKYLLGKFNMKRNKAAKKLIESMLQFQKECQDNYGTELYETLTEELNEKECKRATESLANLITTQKWLKLYEFYKNN